MRTATLEAYQTVANPIPGDAYSVRESDDCAITLTHNAQAIKSFTHKSIFPNYHPKEEFVRQLSWTQFSFAGRLVDLAGDRLETNAQLDIPRIEGLENGDREAAIGDIGADFGQHLGPGGRGGILDDCPFDGCRRRSMPR